MKVTVIGSGYVGLVTGACLSEMGNDVLCFDVDHSKIALLNSGGVPIHEPGLAELIHRNVAAGRLRFSTEAAAAAAHGVLQFIAVGTPPDEDGSADLKYVLAAARSIGQHMSEYKVVVDKSTVPVGTADKVSAAIADELAQRGVELPFTVVSNPEFLKEGAAIEDFMSPDRVVIGSEEPRAIELMRALYAPYVRNHERFLVMSTRSAELTKYAANSMLATRISFMNELAELAEHTGADIESVRLGIGSDSRIGYSFLYAGCGYGGSCFPKDVKALIKTASGHGQSLRVLSAVEEVNNRQKHLLAKKAKAALGGTLSGKHFALWGLAFKPNTDDMREAASREIIADLLAEGATVTAYDPVAMDEARRIYQDEQRISFSNHPLAACQDADALLIATEWKEFRNPDFDAIKDKLRQPIIIDGRNLYSPAAIRQQGFTYHSIGRH
ncbi:UDP-glucose dehydrogenase family protein [Dyella acidiphila]|uniref:UDP-glucose 6-dehydrogenase n=1 Tax=Dyella acidiphila TaxID=2775866 RepID=A0ABR9G590_9GAMM|nr:UDP-glucose/GDP-mannose dehydrogenase family protein [Dyella acidiphila]MBE1159177.1 UDP-glucose/GDP-mannose dehydrogenase family protein [Dyella acidiphila]